ncbi:MULTISPECIES: PTS sugar transporter subunit IIB [Collinsella]|uniref:PTS sugar transporter subunit IIB n=1 Tax=Collinsella TaxID=102106 RepID=UPI000B382BAF|nr:MULTISPECIES: PTS sugar transporter subunit IIB [Collinsella]MBM6683496.1 PTS sugar transporter subunit IIB [Collinsella intestinalis]OUN46227.1 PTS sugar transporter subunit IIB [Collinsella sp. An7]
MKVLLVCAGGMSTSILMKKMEKYAADQGIADFEIAAVGVAAYKDIWQNYDCILLGPQVGYRKADIAKDVEIPVAVMAPQDYGLGNCPNIFKQIEGLIG